MENKTKRKVFAATASAALVASAVVPAATFADTNFTDISNLPADEQAAINALVNSGVINGKGDGIFDPFAQMKRAEAASVVAKLLNLDVNNAPDAGFDDVANDYWGKPYIDAAVAADVLQGKGDGKFDPETAMKRAEFAQLVVKALDLELVEGVEHNFTDVADDYWGKEAIDILYSHGLINGKSETRFAPEERMQRNHVALLLNRTLEAVNAEASVNSVSAINTTTLKLTGTGLNNLKAEDVKVSNNSVVSVTPSTDGKSATVILNGQLLDEEEVVVTVGEKEFKFTFTLEILKAGIKSATYDDDTAKQYVKLEVDGSELTGADLVAAGYDVKFEAFSDKAGLTPLTGFFENDDLGLLSDDIATDASLTIPTSGVKVYVSATITKGSDVVSTGLTEITIKNLDLATEVIDTKDVRLAGTTHAMTKDILVVGDDPTIHRIKVKVDGKTEWVTSGYSAKSSNPGVIAVDNTGAKPVLTAVTPGTATITVEYGNTTQTYTYKVENGTREVTSAQFVREDSASASAISSKNLAISGGVTSADNTVYVKVFDQFGELFDPTDSDITVVSSDTNKVSVTTIADSDSDYVGELELTPVAKGSAFITLTYTTGGNTYKLKSNTFRAEVYDNATASTYKLEIDKDNTTDDADDYILNIADTKDDELALKLVPYTAQGIALAPINVLSDATVDTVQTADVITATATANGVDIVVGTKTGTASVTVTYNGKTYTQKITVIDEPTAISAVQWKSNPTVDYAKTYTYEDVLQVTKSGNDDILRGITVKPASSQPVRITSGNVVYLDKNADGSFDTNDGDVKLGEFSFDFIDLDGTVTANQATHAVTAGDEGTLVYKIVDDSGKVVASSSAKIDVN